MSRRDRPVADHLADMLDGLRAEGIPDRQIARETGLARQTIHRLRSGDGRQPGWDTVRSIEEVYQRRVPRTGTS